MSFNFATFSTNKISYTPTKQLSIFFTNQNAIFQTFLRKLFSIKIFLKGLFAKALVYA